MNLMVRNFDEVVGGGELVKKIVLLLVLDK